MSNVLAGVGRGQLRVLDERVAARRAIYQRYVEKLGHLQQFTWMPEPAWSYSTHWLSACTLDAKRSAISCSDLIQNLADDKIEARPVWKPMHLQPIFRQYPSFDHADTSVAAHLFEHSICLPSGSNMSQEQQDRVIDVIIKHTGM
jgi:dTDP-4-amino-4,6-dideoxygalactose transaminase